MTRLATLEEDGWTLECGETRHAEAPETFWIPPQGARSSLEPDQIVKLMFRIAHDDESGQPTESVERMWVVVAAHEGDRYRGVLDNDPFCTEAIRAGLEVDFEPRHVIQIYED